jgi:hypothetical protein
LSRIGIKHNQGFGRFRKGAIAGHARLRREGKEAPIMPH